MENEIKLNLRKFKNLYNGKHKGIELLCDDCLEDVAGGVYGTNGKISAALSGCASWECKECKRKKRGNVGATHKNMCSLSPVITCGTCSNYKSGRCLKGIRG